MSVAVLIVLTLALIALGLFATLAIGLAKGLLDLYRTVSKLAADAAPDVAEISDGAQRAQVRMADQSQRFQEVQETFRRGFGSLGQR